MEGVAVGPMASTRSGLSRAALLGWASVVLYTGLTIAALLLEVRFVGAFTVLDLWVVIALAACGLVGALIVSRHPRHRIGWMFCAAPLFFGASWLTRQYAILALVVAPGTLPFGHAMAWFGFWLEVPAISLFVLFLPLLFPDGHLPSARWRPVALGATAVVGITVLLTMVAPGTYALYPSIRNPVGLDQFKPFFDAIDLGMQALLLVVVLVGAGAVFSRLRGADADERRQIKWFAYAGAILAITFVVDAAVRFVPSLVGVTDVLAGIALSAFPAAVGIAILRNRLYDIDLIINRTLVYVLLTAILAGVYTAAVALFQRSFVAMTGQNSDLAIVMTLFVLATVFTPIKNTLQATVDRRIKPSSRPVVAHSTSIDDLLMLNELHDRGVLTDEEFAAKKKQVLGI
ncbi:MAG TPA: SHOCT domain-containing protein [Candidatus Limnocylindria bacterium]|nr:SHOCT domain-containing protein [Candidatus Limnocylindria bacterium]